MCQYNGRSEWLVLSKLHSSGWMDGYGSGLEAGWLAGWLMGGLGGWPGRAGDASPSIEIPGRSLFREGGLAVGW